MGLIALIAGATAVVVVIAAVVVIVVIKPGGKGSPGGFVPTGSTPSADAQQLGTVFLQAWDSGNLQQAAAYTDDPAAARTALTVYRKDLHLKKLTGTVTSAVADASTTAAVSKSSGPAATPTAGVGAATTKETVTMQLNATVSTAGTSPALSGKWTYQTTLVAYQQVNSSSWYINWVPAVVAPNLTASEHLAAVTVPAQVVSVTDSSGGALSSYNDAGLSNIATLLQQQGTSGKGRPGLYVEIQTAKGKAVPNSQAVVVSPSNIADLSTTINPQAEAAARSVVGQHSQSSIVVIQPSTGDILAIANNDGFNDFALTAQVAPGSDFKIITSTALINAGLTTANSDVECPSAFTVQGITYHNNAGESEPASTPFSYDFAQSCNNAFTQWWPHLYGKLASTAKDYYGLNQKWDIGIGNESAQYLTAPPTASGAELAQEDFGQGELLASPIAMASVAATVDSGTFRQPILVPGTKQLTATALPKSTDSQLYAMMRDVVTEGTANGLGLGPDVYAKTGTADVVGEEQPNSWLVAFDPNADVAVADMVLNSGYGASIAGPEVAAFLNKYSS